MQKTQKVQNIEKQGETHSEKSDLVKKSILGVGVTNASKENILEFIIENLKKKAKPYYVVTPNPEIIVLATKSPDFKKILNNAKIALNDGIGISFAARFLGRRLRSRTTGVELLENLCERVADWPITVGFLGGRPHVAEKASECLKKNYPNLKISFGQAELPDPKKLPETEILFIAYGAPKQEFWMDRHLGKIPVRVMIGVGGAFDQIVYPSLRPPQVIQGIGFGWLYRLFRQPWRIKRQLALVEFVWLVLKEKLGINQK